MPQVINIDDKICDTNEPLPAYSAETEASMSLAKVLSVPYVVSSMAGAIAFSVVLFLSYFIFLGNFADGKKSTKT